VSALFHVLSVSASSDLAKVGLGKGLGGLGIAKVRLGRGLEGLSRAKVDLGNVTLLGSLATAKVGLSKVLGVSTEPK